MRRELYFKVFSPQALSAPCQQRDLFSHLRRTNRTAKLSNYARLCKSVLRLPFRLHTCKAPTFVYFGAVVTDIDRKTGKLISGLPAIRQSLETILRTRQGERVMRPEFGVSFQNKDGTAGPGLSSSQVEGDCLRAIERSNTVSSRSR